MSSPPRLGALLALTGPEAVYAREMEHAITLAFEDARLPLDVRIADDHADAGQATEAARRLAGDPSVVAVVGPMNSWTCASAGAVFAAAGLPHITPSASNAALSAQGWPTFFRACPSDSLQARALAAVADRLVGAKRVAAVDDHSSFAAPLCAEFLSAAAARGLVPVLHASVEPGDLMELESAARILDDAAPDAILIAGLEAPCRDVAQTLRTHGVSGVFLGTDGLKPSRALRVDGYPGPWLTNSGTDARHQVPGFHARMLARAPEHRSIYTVECWEATRLLLELLKSGARSRQQMREALTARARGDGPLVFDRRGERLEAPLGVYVDEESGPRFVGHASELFHLTCEPQD